MVYDLEGLMKILQRRSLRPIAMLGRVKTNLERGITEYFRTNTYYQRLCVHRGFYISTLQIGSRSMVLTLTVP